MIMQTQDRFAMFYLLGLKHSDPAVLHENLTSLTQMMGFIIFLERERYMTIYRSHFTTDLNFHYLGEVIGNPHIDHKKLILNDEGLYSLEPGMIMNKQDECVYLGTKLQGVSYDLAYQTMVGGLVIHPSIKDLCETMG